MLWEILHKYRIFLYVMLANAALLALVMGNLLYVKVHASGHSLTPIGEEELLAKRTEQELTINVFESHIIQIPAGFEVHGLEEADFVTVTATEVIFAPGKYDSGEFEFVLRPTEIFSAPRDIYTVHVISPKFDEDKLKAELIEFLGADKDHFGIYLYDLQRDQVLDINGGKDFPPASISKLPIAVLTLRDIDAGIRSLSDTYPIQNNLKHGSTDPLAKLPAGTKITIKEYLTRLILESNNTAQYHLRTMLGGAYEAVNPRTAEELNANPFFEDPLIARPVMVERVLEGVYKEETLSPESAEFLLNLLKTTPPDLKLAIPSGVPEGTVVANKVGFLFGGREGDTYSDAGIVYGPKTDYILVVLNDRAPKYPNGAYKIRDISKIVYKHLEK